MHNYYHKHQFDLKQFLNDIFLWMSYKTIVLISKKCHRKEFEIDKSHFLGKQETHLSAKVELGSLIDFRIFGLKNNLNGLIIYKTTN